MKESGVEGFVLAGGMSLRMGTPKAFLPYEDSTLLQRSIEVLQGTGVPVRLVAAAEDQFAQVSVPVVIDRFPGAGPLGAIYTALSESASRHCLFLACDTPLVEPDLFEVVMEHADSWDAVIPVDSKGQLHPLSAYYSSTCRDVAGNLLGKGRRRVGELLEVENLRVRQFHVSEFGIPDRYFHNVNTPGDYEVLLGAG